MCEAYYARSAIQDSAALQTIPFGFWLPLRISLDYNRIANCFDLKKSALRTDARGRRPRSGQLADLDQVVRRLQQAPTVPGSPECMSAVL
jgi:hypothetical protein